MGSNGNRTPYFSQLGFIRFLLALGVVLFHYGDSFYPFNQGVVKQLITGSTYRVSFFFFISGFVMSLVYPQLKRSEALHFWKRRLTRLAPLYLIAFLITLILVLFVKQALPKGMVIITHALMLQSLYPGFALDLNYPTWSISVEIFFYACFPFINQFILNRSVKQILSIFFVLWVLSSIQHYVFIHHLYNGEKRTAEFIDAFPLWHLSTFVGGMLTAHYTFKRIGSDIFTRFASLFLLVSLMMLLLIAIVKNPIQPYIHNGLLMPCYASIVLALYGGKTVLGRLMSTPLLSRSGDLSFAVFLFQYPLWLVMHDGLHLVNGSVGFLIYLLALVGLAILVHQKIEQPLIQRFRR